MKLGVYTQPKAFTSSIPSFFIFIFFCFLKLNNNHSSSKDGFTGKMMENMNNVMLEDNFLTDKIRYILNNPSQRELYISLQNNEDRIAFFIDHFIMTDHAVRQIKNMYLGSEQSINLFLDLVYRIIVDAEEAVE